MQEIITYLNTQAGDDKRWNRTFRLGDCSTIVC